MTRKIWLTWETQRRNDELARAFGAELSVIDHSVRRPVVRYLLSAWQTVGVIRRARPALVVAQCPSLLLVGLVALLRLISRFTFVIDAHNAFFEYAKSPRPAVRALLRFAAHRSDFIIVSNSALVPPAEQLGATPLVLPDKLPQFAARPAPEFTHDLPPPVITLISSFAKDEPLADFLTAFSEHDIPGTLLVTGRKERAGKLLRFESKRIRFTGFLSHENYEALLLHSDLLVDLTRREDCLLCGAYEAVAAQVPILLSDSPALRSTFRRGALFSANTPRAFQQELTRYLSNPEHYKREIREFRIEYEKQWRRSFEEVEAVLNSHSKVLAAGEAAL